MQNNEISKWKKHALGALHRMKHSRHYALDEEGELALGRSRRCLARTARRVRKKL